jgi:hypothetical protein
MLTVKKDAAKEIRRISEEYLRRAHKWKSD